MWSHEKLWVGQQHSNKQNGRYWADNDPNVEIDCKQQRGRCIMCWAGLTNGEVILHINKPKCLFLNASDRYVAKSCECFQQGTILVSAGWVTPHTAVRVMEIWRKKPFHREATISKKFRSISPGLLILVYLLS